MNDPELNQLYAGDPDITGDHGRATHGFGGPERFLPKAAAAGVNRVWAFGTNYKDGRCRL